MNPRGPPRRWDRGSRTYVRTRANEGFAKVARGELIGPTRSAPCYFDRIFVQYVLARARGGYGPGLLRARRRKVQHPCRGSSVASCSVFRMRT